MYLTSPISATFCLTSSVNATGEKTARAPDCKRTTVLSYCDEFLAIALRTYRASASNLYPAEAQERD